MDRGVWCATVHGITKSWTWLSNCAHTHTHTHTHKQAQGGSVQFSSVSQLRLTLCNPMHCSTPGFPVLHYLPKFAQIHVHWVGDAIKLFEYHINIYQNKLSVWQTKSHVLCSSTRVLGDLDFHQTKASYFIITKASPTLKWLWIGKVGMTCLQLYSCSMSYKMIKINEMEGH